MKRVVLILTISLGLIGPAFAVEPDEVLADPLLEERARSISKGLRCVVCQNQDIDSSNAGVARDLRILVRERLVAGDTDDEVMAFVRARYGDYVLMSPPLNRSTIFLWAAPFLFGGLSIFALFAVVRRGKTAKSTGLTPEEEAELATLLTTGSDKGSDR